MITLDEYKKNYIKLEYIPEEEEISVMKGEVLDNDQEHRGDSKNRSEDRKDYTIPVNSGDKINNNVTERRILICGDEEHSKDERGNVKTV